MSAKFSDLVHLYTLASVPISERLVCARTFLNWKTATTMINFYRFICSFGHLKEGILGCWVILLVGYLQLFPGSWILPSPNKSIRNAVHTHGSG